MKFEKKNNFTSTLTLPDVADVYSDNVRKGQQVGFNMTVTNTGQ